ncbi:8-oxo-dGTP pyrophosphatase MutT, NUDIX family [Arachidicoccus rhizosphaerae]|jgi:8-oxo-dGTP pyrophosphatase MutT (NUDIX family)|uniref:GDP-mannose pyrophosphatase n=1 Tax=Arachidicoccus rhizosphaerae TaxID=551991 RepID=A0A1H3YK68_9BACT|nr:NUDIX hydrolase [Arachidicoccus rhizosphaerae]SEA11404.1 8-oxo-dGTP pyrophosphatase MutT, NUDIX family [Arachidicoccus rhizosphaerae]
MAAPDKNKEQAIDDPLKWKVLDSSYLFKENWFTVRKDTCERADGKIIDPYYVFEFPEWVTALAVTAEDKVLMVRQYRHALGEVGLELPGGCVDDTDENFEDAIRRELLEETGYAFESAHYLGKISANPSTNSNLMHMFVATGGRKIKEQELDENEEIEVLELSFEQLITLIEEKRINQAMHISTILYGLRYLGKLSLNP